MKNYARIIIGILVLVFLILVNRLFPDIDLSQYWIKLLQKSLTILFSSFVLIEIVRLVKKQILKRYDLTAEDNFDSRKIHTQINLLEKVIVFVIILTAIGLIALSIDSIKKIGIGIFASAGVVGIIIGLSAQKIVGALLAGIQIAFTQPFRVDDAVYVENEWGWIEEINLTYVVVRIWDKRRLVLPSTYFLDKPFQNWTRTSGDIVGSIFLYTDYSISFDALRKELTRILNATDLWDKKVNVLQVTESKESTVETRILVSAKNSPTCWDLRVLVREKLITFIQQNYPESLPRTRIRFENQLSTSSSASTD